MNVITRRIGKLVPYAFLAILSFVSVFPFIWMVIGMTNKSNDIIRGKLSIGTFLIQNVSDFLAKVDAPLIFYNSFKVAIGSTIFTLLISSIAGYGFEMFRSKIRERLYSAMLLTLMIPFAAMMIPLFIMMGKAGAINTHLAIILPSVSSAFIIFFFRQCTKAFPSELRDAAKMDGLKEWQIFFKIYMPVMKSTYAAAFIIVFMAAWNNYLWPLIVLQSNELKTITLVISSLSWAYTPNYGVVMVGTVFATLPIVIVFFAMQRQFVQGMLGSVKG